MVGFLFSHKTRSCSAMLSTWLENSQATGSGQEVEATQAENYVVSKPANTVPSQKGTAAQTSHLTLSI